ncbi:MAG TPA: phosphatidate cytidylyltransferase [Blastocatellia bacterium]|nr:phosphatidate cytidylyltransferase [Blastocatellia bacterium]
MKRILTALVGLPILLYTVWSQVPYFFVLLAGVAALLALGEFYNICAKIGNRAQVIPGYVAGVLVLACFVADALAGIAAVLAALVIVSLTIELATAKDLSKTLGAVAVTLMGVIYVVMLAGYLVGVRMITDGLTLPPVPHLAAKLLTMFFAMVMLTDTGAFYTGRSLGRHKLAPRISPGKTIEGAVGGLITAILVGPLCRYTFFPEIPLLHAMLLGAAIGVVGQVGDLAESMLKRGAQVKDSSNLLPGHGGMLDRVDSLLFCAPLLYYYARWFLPKW